MSVQSVCFLEVFFIKKGLLDLFLLQTWTYIFKPLLIPFSFKTSPNMFLLHISPPPPVHHHISITFPTSGRPLLPRRPLLRRRPQSRTTSSKPTPYCLTQPPPPPSPPTKHSTDGIQGAFFSNRNWRLGLKV
ncbi:hypothetical protein Hanom_Chr11g01034861 [Helianthus anomalus]